MNTKNYLLGAIAIVFALCSCNDYDDNKVVDNGRKTIDIQTVGDDYASTRFNGTTGYWENGDAIGVYMMTSDNTSSVNGAENIKYITATEGSNVAKFSSETSIVVPEVDVNFHAYYPHSGSLISNGVYKLDLQDQSVGYKKFDMMYATTSKTPSELENGKLALKFAHKVCKAKIVVTLAGTITGLSKVTIAGLNAKADFSIIGGNIDNEVAGIIVPQETTANNIYEAILLPTTDISNLVLNFETENGLVYQWSGGNASNIRQFQAGNEYIFNIGLGTSPGAMGTIDEITAEGAAPWGDGNHETDKGELYTNVPDGYARIDVKGTDTNIGDLLNGKSGDVALVFEANTVYSYDNSFQIPSGIQNLLLLSDQRASAKVKMTEFTMESTLNSLSFYNLEIEGTSGKSLCNGANVSSLISIKKCYFHDMDNAFRVSGGSLNEFLIDDCKFYNVGGRLVSMNGSDINTVTLAKSTFCDVSILFNAAGAASKGTDYHIDYCTLSGLGNVTLDFNGEYKGLLSIKRSVFVSVNSWFQTNQSSIEKENNYATTEAYGASGGLRDFIDSSNSIEYGTLFSSAQGTGEFFLKNPEDIQAGDPRWW